MCGMFGHGFYWQENGEYKVLFDFEINSHSAIKEHRPEMIPAHAKRCGFDPISGEPVSNEKEPLPDKVKEKIHYLFQMYYPDPSSIADWLKLNYAKNNDKDEWDYKLLFMLADKGAGLFSAQYYTQRAQYCTQWAQDCTQQAQDYTQRAQYCTQWAQDCTQQAQDCTQQAQYYTQRAQYCTQQAQDCTQQAQDCTQQAQDYTQQAQYAVGDLDSMDMDKFIDYFMKNPNKYWSGRNTPREVPYTAYLTV